MLCYVINCVYNEIKCMKDAHGNEKPQSRESTSNRETYNLLKIKWQKQKNALWHTTHVICVCQRHGTSCDLYSRIHTKKKKLWGTITWVSFRFIRYDKYSFFLLFICSIIVLFIFTFFSFPFPFNNNTQHWVGNLFFFFSINILLIGIRGLSEAD